MTISIRSLHPLFMGKVSGLDLRQPVTAAGIAAINAGMDRHAVLIFPGQVISQEEHLTFSRLPARRLQRQNGTSTHASALGVLRSVKSG